MPKISNAAHRNVSLMFAIAFFCSWIYCVYATISKGESLWGTAIVLLVTIYYAKSYIVYRKEVKKGNLYGNVRIRLFSHEM